MRTNIEIDDKLMKTAQNLSKIKTKKELIAVALESFIKELRRKEFHNYIFDFLNRPGFFIINQFKPIFFKSFF